MGNICYHLSNHNTMEIPNQAGNISTPPFIISSKDYIDLSNTSSKLPVPILIVNNEPIYNQFYSKRIDSYKTLQ